MQDPVKRAKMEEAQKKQEEEKKKRKDLLVSVAKKIDSWGLKEHHTVLGPNTIGYFRSKSSLSKSSTVDNFSEIVIKHNDEIREMMIGTFPQMPKIEGIKQCMELAKM